MRVKLTRTAQAERNHAILRSSETSPEAAARLYARFTQVLEKLDRFPRLGYPGKSEGTREINVPGTRYIIVYRLEARTVVVLHFRHQSARPET